LVIAGIFALAIAAAPRSCDGPLAVNKHFKRVRRLPIKIETGEVTSARGARSIAESAAVAQVAGSTERHKNQELGTWNLELGTWNLELGTWNLELAKSDIFFTFAALLERVGLFRLKELM
jgi:hypothetical protein